MFYLRQLPFSLEPYHNGSQQGREQKTVTVLEPSNENGITVTYTVAHNLAAGRAAAYKLYAVLYVVTTGQAETRIHFTSHYEYA